MKYCMRIRQSYVNSDNTSAGIKNRMLAHTQVICAKINKTSETRKHFK